MPQAGVLTEKDFPITTRWVFKAPLITLVINVAILFFGYISIKLLLVMIISIIYTPFLRSHFHFSLGDKFFDLKQGVFSKKTRHLPYGVIQTVFVKQDLIDRMLGIASLTIEDASYNAGGAKKAKSFRLSSSSTRRSETIGGSGNKINIPGLKKEKAEALKNILLQKIQENPIEDSQSGL